ncbi:hypothetical protein [Klebsiella pneumoniae]|uniref:hypothetical protein n=1 Tax=Klebsiella pneumoniae TaxID=573 RepID=UPI003F75C6B0
MKDDIKNLIAAARSAYPDMKTVQRLCDELEKSAQFNDDTLAIKIGLQEDNRRLMARVKELGTVCAESYQVVGALANVGGVFNELPVIKALDNLSAQKLVHTDVLPFSLPFSLDYTAIKKAANYPVAASMGMTGIPPMSPECFRQHAILSAMNGMLASGCWDNPKDLVSDALVSVNHLTRELAK